MAVANSTAETVMAKAAAKTFWLVEANMVHFLPFYVSASLSCRMPEGLQEPCQIRETAENGEFIANGAACHRGEIPKVGRKSQLVGSMFVGASFVRTVSCHSALSRRDPTS